MRHSLLLFAALCIGIESFGQKLGVGEIVRLALENNYDIRIEKTFAEAASTDKNYAVGAFLPQINGVATRSNTYTDQELRFQDESRNNKGEVRSQSTTAAIIGTWTLFDGTRMFAALRRVNVAEEQSQYLVKEQMVATIASVIQNYYDIVRRKQQLVALEEQLGVSQERVRLAERKFQVGTGAKPELLQAKVDYNALRTQAIQQEVLIQQLKDQLNALVDLKLPNGFDVSDTIEINLSLKDTEILQDIETHNYSLRATRTGIDVAKLGIWEQRALGLPSLDLNAAYNYNRLNNLAQINPFGAIYNLSQGFNFGLTLNVPILNNLNNRRLVQQSKIIYDRQQLLFNQERVNVNTAVKNAFVNYDNARKVLVIEEENILLARENMNIALEVFRRGASTFVELRTAQQSLADAYTRLINARYLAKVAETELLRLNGSLLQ